MSRIGKKPIAIPAGVDVKIDGKTVTVKGAKVDFDSHHRRQYYRPSGKWRDCRIPSQ